MSSSERVRFLHSSDWQLGMRRAFMHGEAAARFSQARIDAITRLGELALAHQAAFILVAGDVFESNQLSRLTVERSAAALRSLPVPVFLLPGNHDPLDGSSLFDLPEFRDPGAAAIVLRDGVPVPVPGIAGVEVVGAPWRNKHPSGDLCAAMLDGLAPADRGLRIAVAHGQVDSLAPDPGRPGVIRLAAAEAALAEGRMHYLALGDRHSVTSVGDSGRIWFSGTPVATDFGEQDPNRALLVELDPKGACRVEPLEVGDWHFLAEHWHLNGASDLDRLDSRLLQLPARERTCIRLGLTGSVNLATAARLDQLLESRAALFASLRRHERSSDLAVVPDSFDQDSVSLAGYARLAWDELLAEAPHDAVAEAALQLCYRLSRGEPGG